MSLIAPFWNEQCRKASSKLWLPTEIDLRDPGTASSNLLSGIPIENSWFSTRQVSLQSKSSPLISYQSHTSFLTKDTGLEITKSKCVRLYASKEQTKLLKHWTDGAREIYNFILLDVLAKGSRKANWMSLNKEMTGGWPEHLKGVPFQIRSRAIKEACDAFFSSLKAAKKLGRPARFQPRSIKRGDSSCFIPSQAIKAEGVYPRISGRIQFAEPLPEKPLDSRLVMKCGKFYLMVPHKTKRAIGENQARIVSLDPGIRKFTTFFSENSCGYLGDGDFSRIQRLSTHLDNLLSRASRVGKRKKRRMLLAADRMRFKVRNLITELHWQIANFLTSQFDVILLPTFETQQMSSRVGRKIGRKSVRAMLNFSHYAFRRRLNHKAFERGKVVVDVCEAYTSKTNPLTGELMTIGGAKSFASPLGRIDRDINGARNILLRALTDRPSEFLACSQTFSHV